jgi:hypothetical protein
VDLKLPENQFFSPRTEKIEPSPRTTIFYNCQTGPANSRFALFNIYKDMTPRNDLYEEELNTPIDMPNIRLNMTSNAISPDPGSQNISKLGTPRRRTNTLAVPSANRTAAQGTPNRDLDSNVTPSRTSHSPKGKHTSPLSRNTMMLAKIDTIDSLALGRKHST